ncbi:protein transport protein SEC31-like isoform 2 [Corchorus olitorius]|uniref:Protein transport protein SEC31-like isoform 2 n=1 Tax=Corchorus olitorius TaxID=93759 RepID=A0A1R3JR88_9ROSI|nr:protein transport protein SEC31-like isoform 2 [Corchorus olitorius]
MAVSAMVNNDLMSLVNTRPLKFWKETLALLCTFAQREEWTELCDTLAAKLMVAGNTLAATLYYICAGNIDKTVEIWSKDLMENTIALALATGQKQFSASLCKLVDFYITWYVLRQWMMVNVVVLLCMALMTYECINYNPANNSHEKEKETKTALYENSNQASGSVFESSQPIYQHIHIERRVTERLETGAATSNVDSGVVPCGA